jgi:uncharacterized protein YndB with AHSA1/START domain
MKITAEAGKQDIVVTRAFNASVDLVFRTHIEPDLFARWYGCHGMKTDMIEFDPRRGGTFKYAQTINGRDFFISKGVYHDVISQESIIRTVENEAKPGRVALETMRFAQVSRAATQVTAQFLFQSISDRDEALASGAKDGTRESFERLDQLLESLCRL